MRVTWLRSCPRCLAGDVTENRDMYGNFVLCIQCGYYLTDREIARLWDIRSLSEGTVLSNPLEPVPGVLARR